MKIGIDCHNLEGRRTGVGRYLWNLLREWANPSGSPLRSFGASEGQADPDGLKVEFFLYFKNEIPQDVQKLFANVRGSTPHIRNLKGKSNAIFKHWLLPRAAAQDQVDILFCPDYILPFYVGRLTFHIKTAVTIHDIIYEARPREYSWPSWKDKVLLKWASKQSARKADVIFAPSEFTKSEILKYYKVNSAKVVVTPLAPDPIFKARKDPSTTAELGAGHSAERNAEIRGNGNARKYFLFVGSIFNRRFLPQKIQAFTEFGKKFPEFKFLIIGKNHTKPFLDIGALVAGANAKLGREAVVWKEHVSDEELVHLYNRAFATLWLSSYEGFGLPVLESMACGTPVITSPYGSLPQIAGDAAMYVTHPENPQEISNALTHLARYDSYRNELIVKGLARAAQFLWQKTARQTIDRILELV